MIKTYVKCKLPSIDGVYDLKNPVPVKGEKEKQLPETFVKSENANYKITGIIYKEIEKK